MNVRRYSKFLIVTILIFCIIFTFIFFLSLYPLKHKEIIKKYADIYNFSPEFVASVINTESSFNKMAVSGKGAVGLMQLLPATAQWIAEKEGIDYSYQSLFDAEYNINLGLCYLSYLKDKFDVVDTAVVAYNAGEGNVIKWLEDKEYSPDGKVLTKIPFKESENYLKRINNSIGIYKIRLAM